MIAGDAAKSLILAINGCRAASSGHHAFPIRESTHSLCGAALGALAIAVRGGNALLAANARAAAIRLAFVRAAFGVLFGAGLPRQNECREEPERSASHDGAWHVQRPYQDRAAGAMPSSRAFSRKRNGESAAEKLTLAALARKLGVSRAWVTKVQIH